jgi:hypothetical protein
MMMNWGGSSAHCYVRYEQTNMTFDIFFVGEPSQWMNCNIFFIPYYLQCEK